MEESKAPLRGAFFYYEDQSALMPHPPKSREFSAKIEVNESSKVFREIKW